MSSYLKVLGLHVYLATNKKSYIENGKYLEANTQAMIALKQTLNNNYLSKVFILKANFHKILKALHSKHGYPYYYHDH